MATDLVGILANLTILPPLDRGLSVSGVKLKSIYNETDRSSDIDAVLHHLEKIAARLVAKKYVTRAIK